MHSRIAMDTLAQTLELPNLEGTNTVEGLLNPSTFGGDITLGSIIARAIPFVFAFAGIGLLLMLLASGFSFLTSAGDAKKLESARQRLTYAIIGFIVIFTAYWVVQLVGIAFGLEEITSVFR